MVLSWTKTRVFRRARKGKGLSSAEDGGEIDVEVVVPAHFRCPITLELMKDPVTLSTGITYDRDSIEKWLEDSKNRTCCPVTNQPLPNLDIVPNHTIRRMIQDWCVDHRSYGIQRIPTPRIPVTKYQISEICNKIITATERRDLDRCQNLVGKIKIWGKESERNKRCIVENGTGVVLASAFHSFSNDDSVFSFNKNVAVLEDILGVLTWACTFPSQAQSLLGSEACLRTMVWFLNGNNLTSRQNAALVLKQVSFEELSKKAEGINLIEALVKMIKEEASIGASGIKACLRTIFLLVSHGDQKEKMVRKCLDLGLVSLLLELSVDGERGICEKTLGVLDCLCESQKGKQEAKENALTLPLVVKKILRVSGLASQFGVSILWKLCLHKKEEQEEERVINIMEALQAGAFQKLLVLLQVGCDEITKEKATELLKVMNAFKSRVDCVDSSLDLKYLKK